MNFNQLVSECTRPISGTCLDHIFANIPERLKDIRTIGIGLSDHLPLFAVRKYCRIDNIRRADEKAHFIRYRNMKNFDAEQFKSSLRQAPWDTVFLFDEIDDMLDSWESLVIGAIDSHCPMRDKRVAMVNQAPWMNKSILNQLRHRDACLKTARLSNSPDAWSKYKEERNKSVSL